MWVVFLDESGYTTGNWKEGIKQQPFYVVSAVCFPAKALRAIYEAIRKEIDALEVADHPTQLGQGYEIKAKEIATGAGWWKDHKSERNAVREIMLSAPKKYDGTAILTVIDKARHAEKYAFPDDPYLLGFKFAFERIANFLEQSGADGYCIYDLNNRLQEGLMAQSSQMISAGSLITGYSAFYEQEYAYVLELERILELGFGDSRHSLGLQIADFFATFGYRHYCDGAPPDIGWWNTLKKSLRKVNGKTGGYGLKVFPP